jgi:hypothetical protein
VSLHWLREKKLKNTLEKYSKYSTKHGLAVFRSARYQGRAATQSATGAKNRPLIADAHALSPFSSKLINP